ncbi:MAG: 4-oxalocrotonate tautomerase family protein [Sphingobium sp.]
MPYVKIEVVGPLTREDKAMMVEHVTGMFVEKMGKPAASVFVVIDEKSADDWGARGKLMSELMAPKGEDADAADTSR